MNYILFFFHDHFMTKELRKRHIASALPEYLTAVITIHRPTL
jgi:hypothetical protein